MMLKISRSMKDWYSHWSHFGRSREASLQFYVGMADGSAVLPSIHKIFQPFLDMQEMQTMGFTVEELDASKLGVLTDDCGPVLHEDSMAERLGGLAVSLLTERLQTVSFYMFQYPAKLFSLLHADKALVKMAFAELQEGLGCLAGCQRANDHILAQMRRAVPSSTVDICPRGDGGVVCC